MSKPFATLRVTFSAPFGGRAMGWEGDILADPATDPDGYRDQVVGLLNAMKEKFKEKLEEAQR